MNLSSFTLKGQRMNQVQYPVEESRGYQAQGDLWSPGYFRITLARGSRAAFMASTETFDTMQVLSSEQALEAERERRRRLLSLADPAVRGGAGAELVLAADQFIITPAGRFEEAARARATGDEVRTVAGDQSKCEKYINAFIILFACLLVGFPQCSTRLYRFGVVLRHSRIV